MFKQARRLLGLHDPDFPSKEEVKQVLKATKYTPDIARLESYEWQYYFAADDTMRGFPKYNLIEESAYACIGFTLDHFQFWNWDLGEKGYPVAIRQPRGMPVPTYLPPVGKIKGEVHLIRPHQFRELDTYRENGVQFIRERVRILVPNRKVFKAKDRSQFEHLIPAANLNGRTVITGNERVDPISAWMYIGVPEYWQDVLSGAIHKPVNYFEANNRQWLRTYYQYQKVKL